MFIVNSKIDLNKFDFRSDSDWGLTEMVVKVYEYNKGLLIDIKKLYDFLNLKGLRLIINI